MPRTIRLMLGALVVARDGVCGLVKSILVDPSVPRVVHLLVEPEHRIGLGRLVPVELVCAVERDARDGVDLDCDLAAFATLPLAETSEITSGVGVGYVYVHSPAPLVREVHEMVPEGEASLQAGAAVVATDGEVGKVAGFDVDPHEHHIVLVMVNEGRFPWGHRTVALPISCVAAFNSRIEVKLTTDEVAQVAVHVGGTGPKD